MSEQENIQHSFLENIKAKLPASVSLADELAEVLHISRDSAYRRMRGETVLSLDEVKILSNRYGISLDELLAPALEMVSFQCHAIDHINFTLEGWLKSILGNLEMLGRSPQKELIYSAKEIPIFYYFHFPELAAFKIFFWMKTLLKHPKYQSLKFNPEIISHELLSDGRKTWNCYTGLPSTEIWGHDAFCITLRQIEFYRQCGFFSKPDQVIRLYDQFADLLAYVRCCAENGVKEGGKAEFKLYKSELITADNTVFFKMGEKRMTFITHNTMNLLTTSHKGFCKQIEDFLSDLQGHSVLVSTSGERERNNFFDKMLDAVEQQKSSLEMSLARPVRR